MKQWYINYKINGPVVKVCDYYYKLPVAIVTEVTQISN
jgi:hypothetical protein